MPPIDMVVSISVLLVLGVLAATAAYTDLNAGIVTNRNVLGLLVLGAVVQGWMVVTDRYHWKVTVILLVTGLVIGFGLYAFQYWAAGDGKLFWALCLATPVAVSGASPMDLPLRLFTMAVLLIAAYMVIVRFKRLWFAARRLTYVTFRNWRHPTAELMKSTGLNLAGSAAYFFAYVSVLSMVGPFVPLRLGILQSLLVAYGLNWLLDQIGAKWRWRAIGALMLGYAVFSYMRGDAVVLNAINSLPAFVAASVARVFSSLADGWLQDEQPLTDLHAGQFLATYILRDPRGSVLVIPRQSYKAALKSRLTVLAGPDDGALSPRHVDELSDMVDRGELPSDTVVKVSWGVPFAPFLCLSSAAVIFVDLVKQVM